MRTSVVLVTLLLVAPTSGFCAATRNVPLDSRLYRIVDRLAGVGAIRSEHRGIRPWSVEEFQRLLAEARGRVDEGGGDRVVAALVAEGEQLLASREGWYGGEGVRVAPVVSARFRSLFFDGIPRSFERSAHDPGDDGVFGIGSSLRPENPYPSPARHHGHETTPLLENDNGTRYPDGFSAELRVGSELRGWGWSSLFLEPSLRGGEESTARLEKGYLKLGGGAFEVEVGRDENWFGFGNRGSITLGNNMENLTSLKVSSPSPFRLDSLSWLGRVKYAFVFSRLDETVYGGVRRQPFFYAAKLSVKPVDTVEAGFSLGRQVGGPGVDNGLEPTLKGLIGGTANDNSNGMAGFEVRWRIPALHNLELFAEFSGEDTAAFWPIVESYLAGWYLPDLFGNGTTDLRFEFFHGNQILYTHSTFPSGYIYRGVPIGHSQGGATEDYFTRLSHWVDPRTVLTLDHAYTTRGTFGILPGQAIEEKHLLRGGVDLPITTDLQGRVMYGIEWIRNMNLVAGDDRVNQLGMVELSWRY